MSWQTRNISWLIVAIFGGHNAASYMLEFDFHVLILHLTASYSYVNNLMHIPANYSCDSWAVLIDMTQDLCIILFMHSLLKLSHELYLHLHMCSLLSLLNMQCEYLFCNYLLSLFVILRFELYVYVMLTFMFCEKNDIYIYNKCIANRAVIFREEFSTFMYVVDDGVSIGNASGMVSKRTSCHNIDKCQTRIFKHALDAFPIHTLLSETFYYNCAIFKLIRNSQFLIYVNETRIWAIYCYLYTYLHMVS